MSDYVHEVQMRGNTYYYLRPPRGGTLGRMALNAATREEAARLAAEIIAGAPSAPIPKTAERLGRIEDRLDLIDDRLDRIESVLIEIASRLAKNANGT